MIRRKHLATCENSDFPSLQIGFRCTEFMHKLPDPERETAKKEGREYFSDVGVWQTVDFILRWVLIMAFVVPEFSNLETAEILLIGFPSFSVGHFPSGVNPWPERPSWRDSVSKGQPGEWDSFKHFLKIFEKNVRAIPAVLPMRPSTVMQGWIQKAHPVKCDPRNRDPVNQEIRWEIFGVSVIYKVFSKFRYTVTPVVRKKLQRS